MAKTCPHCGSHSIKSFPAIYEQQTYRTDSYGVGTSYYAEASSLHLVSSTSYTSSSLARKVAPPPKKEAGWILLLMLAMFCIGIPINYIIIEYIGKILFLSKSFINFISGVSSLLILFVGIPGISIWYCLKVKEYNKKIYSRYYHMWLNSWYCYQCGSSHYSPD